MASLGTQGVLVGDSVFAEVAHEIRVVLRRTGLDRTVAIGALVLARFFGGSVSDWRERRNHKNNSVRRLAERPDCPLSRSSLNRAIAICVVTQYCPSILTLEEIQAGHIGAVLAVPAAQQECWLQQANAQRWSVRQLKEAIRNHRRTTGERRGRPQAPAFRRAVSAIRASLGRLEVSVAFLVGSEPDANSSLQLRRVSERLSALSEQIAQLRSAAQPVRRDSGVWLAQGTPSASGAEGFAERVGKSVDS
jgi:hypothetical protein